MVGVVSALSRIASTVYIFNFYRVYTSTYFMLKYSYKYSCIVYTRAMSALYSFIYHNADIIIPALFPLFGEVFIIQVSRLRCLKLLS